MTLCAMQALGATDFLLQQFEAEYRQKSWRISSSSLSSDWRGATGNLGEYLGLMRYLRAQINRTRINELVRKFLPAFLLG